MFRRILNDVKRRVEQLGMSPQLQVIKTTKRADSEAYIRRKERTLQSVGISCVVHDLSNQESKTIIPLIRELNADPRIKAILVQMPLADPALESPVMSSISPEKDVDGFNPVNIFTPNGIRSCTPAGIMELVAELGVKLSGLDVCVVGKSRVVGLPLTLRLLEAGATVTCCHRATVDLRSKCRAADLLIVAAGSPNLIRGDWVKSGAIVIDVGINSVDGKICGDVDYAAVSQIASFVTPVPGGIGPLTVACLARNVLNCHLLSKHSI